jgi:hypothetical protein
MAEREMVRPEGEITPEQARAAIERRLDELAAERERLRSALEAMDAGKGLDESSRVLLPEDRLRLLRSWRESQEMRLRRGPGGFGGPDGPGMSPDRERVREFMERREREMMERHDGEMGEMSGPRVREERPLRERMGPEAIERMQRFIREGNPLLWAELERVRDASPERFERMIAEQARRLEGDEEAFEFSLRLDRADRELDVLTNRLRERGGPINDEERSVLRSRIAAAYEARMQMLGHRLRRMEERMQQARAEHMKMLESRETMIDQRLREMETGLERMGREMRERGESEAGERQRERGDREQRGPRRDRNQP